MRGAAELRAAAASAATEREAPRALPLVWLLPFSGLATGLLALLVGATPHLVSLPIMLALMAGAPLAFVGLRSALAYFTPPPRSAALGVVDQGLHLKGRARLADELTAKGDTLGPFEAAALEEARLPLWRATSQELALPRGGWSPGEETAPHFVAAALLFLAYAWLAASLVGAPQGGLGPVNSGAVAALDAPAEAPTASPKDAGAEPEAPNPPAAPKFAPKQASAKKPVQPKRGEKAAMLPDDMRASAGKTGKGKSSEAQSQSSASESRGAPSGQSPAPPKESAKKTQASKKPKKKAPADEPTREPKEESDAGGSTAGKGSAKGSNRNTTTSKWSSKDQVTTPDDQEIDEDEDTEDEDEEQKNRGGMQPNLRDRRPPTSRDLRIGFGNRPSPDANGRGGPSEGKKSRGTASLVLGVPIPDRVKGQPNAGPTRITQERIEPSAEDAEKDLAEARRERDAALGELERPAPLRHPRLLAPWQEKLIQAYIDKRRQSAPVTQP